VFSQKHFLNEFSSVTFSASKVSSIGFVQLELFNTRKLDCVIYILCHLSSNLSRLSSSSDFL